MPGKIIFKSLFSLASLSPAFFLFFDQLGDPDRSDHQKRNPPIITKKNRFVVTPTISETRPLPWPLPLGLALAPLFFCQGVASLPSQNLDLFLISTISKTQPPLTKEIFFVLLPAFLFLGGLSAVGGWLGLVRLLPPPWGVLGGGALVALSAFSSRSVAFSAFRAGSLCSVLLRPSSRAFSGAALVCSFASPRSAAAFARRWSVRLGVLVFVRRAPGGWSVSVPVRRRSSRWPACVGRVVVWSGGLRGFCASLGSAGLVAGV